MSIYSKKGKRFTGLQDNFLRLIIGLFLAVFLVGCGNSADEPAKHRYPGMVYIPAGEFVMGTDPEREDAHEIPGGLSKPPYENESPRRKIHLKAFYLDKYEVTYREYQNFIYETGYRKPQKWEETDLLAKRDYPVLYVSWKGAAEFSKWAEKRLPTEAEWEKAARGTNGNRYTWGDDPHQIKQFSGKDRYYPVTGIPAYDKSPFGVVGMMANVAEWTADWYQAYPGNNFPDKDYGKKFRVIRGESFDLSGHYNAPFFYRAAYRAMAKPYRGFQDVGFRCAKSAD